MLVRFLLAPFLLLATFVSIPLCSEIASSAQITYSVVPLLQQIEDCPSEKYPASYVEKIKELLDQKAQKIRVVSYNVLFDLFDDKLKDMTYSWAHRLPSVVRSIENMQPDILCVQEAYPNQIQDLQKSLGNTFNHFVGESTTGELNAIFYNKKRFILDLSSYNASGLSSRSLIMPVNVKDDTIVKKTPNFLPLELEPGRQLTLAHFQDKLTKKSFVVMNTHLTFHRINSREDQAYFIKGLVEKLHSLNKPVILAGDFNTFPNHPDDSGLPFYDGTYICQIFQTVLKESKDAAWLGHVGPLASCIKDFLYHEHKPFLTTETPGVILDHIYVSPTVSVMIHAIEPSLIDNRFPSDHMPIISDILLP